MISSSAKATFRINTFTPQEARNKAKQEWLQAQSETKGKAVPFPADSNRAEGYFWVSDRVRWRCDTIRYYPSLGQDLDRAVFDGEKYLVFNSYQDVAYASGNSDKVGPGAFREIITNPFLGLGYSYLVSSLEEQGWKFIAVGKETVNGYECTKFEADFKNPKGRGAKVSLWFSFQHRAPVRYREEVFLGAANRNYFVDNFFDFEKVDGLELPARADKQFFQLRQGRLEWQNTRDFHLLNCEVNLQLGDGYFRDVLPIGTPIIDEIETPGSVSYIGGNPAEAVEKVLQGTPPVLEGLGVNTEAPKETTLDVPQKQREAQGK